jgi:hypothetical protein
MSVRSHKRERERLDEQLPEGIDLRAVWEGVDDVPVLFVNQVLGQVGQQAEVILTFGQIVPPAILGETPEERVNQARTLTHIPIKPVARLAMTRAGLEELMRILRETAENYDKVQELMAQAQRMAERGDE